MRRLKTIVTVMLALFWLPATLHCTIELVSGLEILSCCLHDDKAEAPDHHKKDCDADGCEEVESGFYKAAETDAAPALPVLPCFGAPIALWPLESSILSLTARNPSTAPPEIVRLWRFTLRAALPARAPTLAC